jgi:type I restriction enzyme S subunit
MAVKEMGSVKIQAAIPETWLLDRLDKFWSVTDCKHVTADFVDSGFPLASIKEVQSKCVQLANAKQTTKHFYDLLTEGGRKPVPGDLIISRNATVGAVAQVAEWHPKFAMGQDVCLLRRRDDGYSPDYLQAVLQSSIVEKQLSDMMVGSTFKRINVQQIKNFVVPMPCSEEQKVIATALSDVDALIAGLEKLIAKQRDLKQAVMQQLLTGQTRLPGFSGEWKVKRLGEICEISMGRTPSRLNPAFWGAGHVWLSIADLHGKVLSSSKEQITPLGASSMRVIPKGTLLMSFKLSIGRLCFAGCDLYTNEAICGFNNLLANSDYLYYALSRTDFSLYGKQAVKGYTLNKKSLALVEVALPSDVEQAAIANVLSSMDAELSDVENRLAKTRDLKQGMMQELLTGRTRLIEVSEK